MKTLVLICFLSITHVHSIAQPNSYRVEQLDSLQKSDPRPVLIFFHTDWCKFCLLMNESTFKELEVIEQMNEKVWFVAFNAEQHNAVKFKGETYQYQSTGMDTGYHQFALELSNNDGSFGYPNIVILNSALETIGRMNGFLDKAELIALIKKVTTGDSK